LGISSNSSSLDIGIMPKLCRDLDLGATGHGCDPVIGVKATQVTVRANGKPVARLNDPTLPHTIENPIPPCISHMEKVNSCSLTVRANSIGVARVGDSFDMGAMIDGSNNVRAG
jgi:uncharacterized Zn-binding protein involved in type VI secretion